MNFMHILGQKEAIWNTIFGIFERRRHPPPLPNVAGGGVKTSPTLSTGLQIEWSINSTSVRMFSTTFEQFGNGLA